MKLKATIPKKSASLLLLRPNPPSNISFYDYNLLVLQRKVSKHHKLGKTLLWIRACLSRRQVVTRNRLKL